MMGQMQANLQGHIGWARMDLRSLQVETRNGHSDVLQRVVQCQKEVGMLTVRIEQTLRSHATSEQF